MMKITRERTRIIFEEYNDIEHRKIDRMVSTADRTLHYEDKDYNKIYIASGMLDTVKQAFPKVSIIDKSSEFWPYAKIPSVEHSAEPRNQLQIDFINFVLEQAKNNRKLAGILSPGTGKQEPISNRIPTPFGYMRMGDIKVGDQVLGINGKPIDVIGTYPQGVRDIYKITFNNGRYALCGLEHLWNVYQDSDLCQKTVMLKDMISDYKTYSNGICYYKYKIPTLSSSVEYNSEDVPIHPYVLGALTDRCSTLVTSDNIFISNKIAKICKLELRYLSDEIKYYFYDANTNKPVITKEFFKDIPEVIQHHSRNVRIPNIYKYNRVEVRMELLRGLMDSNGFISDDAEYTISYSSCSKRLLEDIQEIVRSLGYNGKIEMEKRKYTKGYYGKIILDVPNSFKPNLFSLTDKLHIAEKALSSDTEDRFKYLIVKDIQLIKQEEAKCIAVDTADGLYLTKDFIVTHNTFMACYAALKVGLRTLIIVPTSNIKAQWVETLVKMFKVPSERVLSVNSPKDFLNIKADFAVVSQASLAVLHKKYDLESIMKTNMFGIKVIDEVQMWFHNILKVDASSNICNNWYLTGTFGRSSEEENTLYQTMFGDLAFFREKDKPKTLFNRNPGNIYGMKPHMHSVMIWTKSKVLDGLTDAEAKKILVTWKYSERSDKWNRIGINIPAYTEKIIPADGTMTKFLQVLLDVIKMANDKVRYGKMLVLVPTIASVETVADLIRKIYPNYKVGTIHSRNNKRDNDDSKKNADILVSTAASAGTGFDVPGLSKLIIGQQVKSWILTDQISGRLRRRSDGLDTYLWDIADASIPQLRAWARVRSDTLKRKSKSFKVIDM